MRVARVRLDLGRECEREREVVTGDFFAWCGRLRRPRAQKSPKRTPSLWSIRSLSPIRSSL